MWFSVITPIINSCLFHPLAAKLSCKRPVVPFDCTLVTKKDGIQVSDDEPLYDSVASDEESHQEHQLIESLTSNLTAKAIQVKTIEILNAVGVQWA